jgi:hypothetical protein
MAGKRKKLQNGTNKVGLSVPTTPEQWQQKQPPRQRQGQRCLRTITTSAGWQGRDLRKLFFAASRFFVACIGDRLRVRLFSDVGSTGADPIAAGSTTGAFDSIAEVITTLAVIANAPGFAERCCGLETAIGLAGSFNTTLTIFAGHVCTRVGFTETIDTSFAFFTDGTGSDTLFVGRAAVKTVVAGFIETTVALAFAIYAELTILATSIVTTGLCTAPFDTNASAGTVLVDCAKAKTSANTVSTALVFATDNTRTRSSDTAFRATGAVGFAGVFFAVVFYTATVDAAFS